MFADLTQIPTPLALMLAVICYIAFLRYIDRLEHDYNKKKRPLGDEALLGMLAVLRKKSEYEIFGEAAKKWSVSRTKKEDDFRFYLKRGDIPHYVRDYVRQFKKEIDEYYKPRFPFNDKLPPSWSA